MSLQLELLKSIQSVYPKSQPIDELFGIMHLLGRKQSTGERKLRLLVEARVIDKLDKFGNVIPLNDLHTFISAYRAVDPAIIIKIDDFNQPGLPIKLAPILF